MGKAGFVGEGRVDEMKQLQSGSQYASGGNGKEKKVPAESSELSKEITNGSVEMIEKLETQTVVKPSKKRKLKRHCMRWWCCYGLGIFVLLAAGLPIFFLVIIPAIAQRMVETTSFPIHEVEIMSPTLNSTVVSLRASIKVPPPFTVHLEPITLQLYRPETTPFTPYIEIPLEAQKLKGNTTISITNQTINILDKREFIEFLRGAVVNEKFVMAARGKTTAKIGALKADVTLDKKIELNGLSKLSGFSIGSASVLLLPEDDGSNLLAELTIPNHSIVSFELGNETLNILGPDKLILGNGTIENVYIRPGNNTFNARGYLDLRTLLLNLQPIIAYQATALADGNLQLGASGNSTIYNGEHIDYYEEILNELELTGTVPLISILANSFSQFIGGGLGGLRNLTEQLGINLTQIMEILQGDGTKGLLAEAEKMLGPIDLSAFL